jgi:hypothetical protein
MFRQDPQGRQATGCCCVVTLKNNRDTRHLSKLSTLRGIVFIFSNLEHASFETQNFKSVYKLIPSCFAPLVKFCQKPQNYWTAVVNLCEYCDVASHSLPT